MGKEDRKLGAIVTRNVAMGLGVIRYAQRDVPMDPRDSGWQFSEGSIDTSNPAHAQIWALDEIVQMDPSVECIIGLPWGTKAIRNGANEQWELL